MLLFVDAEDVPGEVTEELSVEYEGRWADAVQAYLEDLKAEHETDDGSIDERAVVDDLLIGLPEEFPIHEVERREL